MPKFSKIHPVRHSAHQMYSLVADIELYPQFVPMCRSLSVRSRMEKSNREIVVADMTVAYGLISETFTSRVILNQNANEIDVSYVDGPFKYLDNKWRFIGTDNGFSDVHFAIDYEFKNRTLGMLMGSMFDIAFSRFTVAFEKRADEIYGIDQTG